MYAHWRQFCGRRSEQVTSHLNRLMQPNLDFAAIILPTSERRENPVGPASKVACNYGVFVTRLPTILGGSRRGASWTYASPAIEACDGTVVGDVMVIPEDSLVKQGQDHTLRLRTRALRGDPPLINGLPAQRSCERHYQRSQVLLPGGQDKTSMADFCPCLTKMPIVSTMPHSTTLP